MKYYRSTGCFCLLFILFFIGVSFGVSYLGIPSSYSTIVNYLLLLAFVLIYVKTSGRNMKETFRLRKFHIGSFFLVILLSVVIRPFVGFVSSVSNLFFQDVTTSSITSMMNMNIFLLLISIAVMPAIVEELICRGVAYSGLRGPRPVKGILLSSLFFGLMHMNFQQILYAFALGLVLGLLVEATNSIYASMVLHFCFNASSVLLLALVRFLVKFADVPTSVLDSAMQQGSGATNTQLLSLFMSLPIAAASVILSFLIIRTIAKLNGRWGYMKTWTNKEIRNTLPKEKATSISYFVALGICIVLAILIEVNR